MNLNLGKRHKQAVQVLNKIEYDSDGNPIGMMEDSSNPASANFGTPREPRRGGCYQGNDSAYITITGLLSTDTVEALDGSDLPTISNGRLDIASGNRIFGVKIFRSGELWAKYNCSENSDSTAYDSSGNGNHGQIINAITTTPEENPNSIHQYQDIYSFENEEGYSNLTSTKNINTFTYGLDINTKVNQLSSWIMYGRFLELEGSNRLHGANDSGVRFYFGLNSGRWRGGWGGNYGDSVILADTDPHLFELKNGKLKVDGIDVWETSSQIVRDVPTIGLFGLPLIQSVVANCKFDLAYSIIYTDNTLVSFIKSDGSGGLIDSIQNVSYKSDNLTQGNLFINTLIPNINLNVNIFGLPSDYVGKVPGKAKFVESSCFKGGSSAYLSITGLLTTDIIEVFGGSSIPTIPTNGQLHVVAGDEVYGVKIFRSGVLWSYLPLCEPIIDPSNHIYHDVSSNGNHASLINGTLANDGKQDEFHYLQRGFSQYLYVFRGIINSNSYIDCGLGVPNISECVSEFTIEMTINPSNQQQQFGRLAGQNSQSSGPFRWFITLASNLEIRYLLFGSTASQGTGIYLTAFNNYRIKFHYNRNSELLSLYVNGILSFTANFTIETADLSNIPLTLGYYLQVGSSDYFFNGFLYNFRLTRDGEVVGFWRLNNQIIDPSTHEYTDSSMYNNPGILVNGSIDNQERLSQGDYTPQELDSELDVYGNEVEFPQDTHSFLNTGTELEAYDYPALKQADKDNNFWFIGNSGPRRINHMELALENLMSNKLFLDITDKNI